MHGARKFHLRLNDTTWPVNPALHILAAQILNRFFSVFSIFSVVSILTLISSAAIRVNSLSFAFIRG